MIEPVAPRLPTILGSGAALVVAGISLFAQVAPANCVLRATLAFTVFAAFGIIIRYLLSEAALQAANDSAADKPTEEIDEITPGTMVGDLLSEQEEP